MKPHSETEENYLKAFLYLSKAGEAVSTNALAHHLGTSAASVTDMVKRLSEKGLAEYTPYRGASLTDAGNRIAVKIIRSHRLWEVFLVEKLGFAWDSVHDVAEQLEHVESPELVRRLDAFLGFPKYDPHGDPIPDENGVFAPREAQYLSEAADGATVRLAGVTTDDSALLQYLDKLKLRIGTELRIIEHLPFDGSVQLEANQMMMVISGSVAKNLLVAAANHA